MNIPFIKNNQWYATLVTFSLYNTFSLYITVVRKPNVVRGFFKPSSAFVYSSSK